MARFDPLYTQCFDAPAGRKSLPRSSLSIVEGLMYYAHRDCGCDLLNLPCGPGAKYDWKTLAAKVTTEVCKALETERRMRRGKRHRPGNPNV